MPKGVSSKIYKKKVVRWPVYKISKLRVCMIFLSKNIKKQFQNQLKLKKKMPTRVCQLKYIEKSYKVASIQNIEIRNCRK